MAALPSIDPAPAFAASPLPWIGAGRRLLRDPTAFFADCRLRLGDTFAVDAFGYRLLCVFSPDGVRNLWALPEGEASKGLADFALLSHKVPTDLFAGRRTFPHDLFQRDDVEVYLGNVASAVETEIGRLGAAGEVELFAFARAVAHRAGLASWGGIGPEAAEVAERLAPLFDALDSSESFVHPSRAFRTIATRKRRERKALAAIETAFAERLQQTGSGDPDDLFERIRSAWSDAPAEEQARGIARDVVLVHMGSQSNLFAALAWTLVHLLERPALLARVRDGDDDLLDRCSHESIRLRQRSIVLRRVLAPVTIADEKAAYRVAPGAFIATMMSVTNTTAAPGLEDFDPDRYRGAQLAGARQLPARELVTTFGHGRHFCPAQRYSTSTIRIATRALLDRFELTPLFRDPAPLRRQIGGVARADRPCRVRYALRT